MVVVQPGSHFIDQVRIRFAAVYLNEMLPIRAYRFYESFPVQMFAQPVCKGADPAFFALVKGLVVAPGIADKGVVTVGHDRVYPRG
jgi:hypothetical protein